MNDNERLLVVDDEVNMRHMLGELLRPEGYLVDQAEDGHKALQMVRATSYDYILCDVKMPKMGGLEFLSQAGEFLTSTTVIMMSAYGTLNTAVEAIQAGAYDFITKPFKPDEVLITLKKARERELLRRENRKLRKQVRQLEGYRGFDQFVTGNRATQSIIHLAEKAAQHNTTVLINGESGTGKELVARGIHNKSPRRNQPFVAINCGSIPENLLESEFFGYLKGAFTGADRDKKGLFDEAKGGSLFLDEIGELPLFLQVKLLRVLQENEIRPIGGQRPKKIDVRVIAATARNLDEEVQQGRFRQDLFFRLNVITLKLPPLRERREDIPLLCTHFIEKLNLKLHLRIQSISPAALALLMKHEWPGNVRELENVLEQSAIFAEKNIILPENIPPNLGGKEGQQRLDDYLGTFSLKTGKKIMEERLIKRALEATGGNKSKAASLLEISYPSLLSKIKEQQ